MKIEDIMTMWTKDSSIDETELATESSNIPVLHNKYLKIFMAERIKLFSAKSELKKKRRVILEYYLGELDQEELQAAYIALNAPGVISGNFMGYQWFDLYPNRVYIADAGPKEFDQINKEVN